MLEQQIVAVAQGMLDGDIDLVAGCRKLVSLHRQAGNPDDPAISTIVGIESETEEFPVGAAREFWAEADLARKDEELFQYLELARPILIEACREILKATGKTA